MKKKVQKKKISKKPTRVRLQRNLSLDPDVWGEFTEVCKKEGRTYSAVIDMLMKKYAQGVVEWEPK